MLVAYSKMTLAEDLLASDAARRARTSARVLRRYFPAQLVERYGDRLESHPLRREIITTVVVNDMINRGGITFAYRAGEETGADPVEIARAYTVVREVFAPRRRSGRGSRSSTTACRPTRSARCTSRRGGCSTGRPGGSLQNRRSLLDVEAEIEHFAPGQAAGTADPGDAAGRGARAAACAGRPSYRPWESPRISRCDGRRMLDAFSLLDIVELANATARTPRRSASSTSRCRTASRSTRCSTGSPTCRATSGGTRWPGWRCGTTCTGPWRVSASNVLALDRSRAVRRRSGSPTGRTRNAEGLARARTTLHEIATGDTFDLATISVALRVIRTLVPSASVARG